MLVAVVACWVLATVYIPTDVKSHLVNTEVLLCSKSIMLLFDMSNGSLAVRLSDNVVGVIINVTLH